MSLTNNQKLELINSIEIANWASTSEKRPFAYTYDNKETRKILYKLGMKEEEINFECYRGCAVLDLISIGLKYANCFSKERGFYNEEIIRQELF